jgi:SagB-type dehydrogenase family enzyme
VTSLVLSFKKNTSLSEDSNNNIVLGLGTMQLNLKQLSPGLLAAFKILCAEGTTEEELSDLVLEIDGGSALPQFYYYLEQFTNLGLICYTLRTDGASLATLVPTATSCNPQFSEIEIDKPYVLSRFAYCHQDGWEMVVETPLFPAKIVLADWRSAAIIAELAQPSDCQALTKIPGISVDAAQMFLRLLLSAKVLSEVAADGKSREEECETLVQWEFHDLLFHSRSRLGRHANPVGKTYRFLGKIDPLPAVKTQEAKEAIELYKPDLEKLLETDAPLTQVLERRKSVRIHGNKPIADKELGEFLYRCARVKAIAPREHMECSDRPYPSGGACYELEFYIAVNTCENIPAGLYHYCPQYHRLEKIADRNQQIEALLNNARNATGEQCLPQLLIILAARFSRVSWAYEAIAYSLILKHVGVLYQTMYLVATAMNLAPCALGTGNSDLFAQAIGTNYYTQSSVGEFILGSKQND